MKRLRLISVAVLLASSVAMAREIWIPALVTDGSGKPVLGLQKDDFVVDGPRRATLVETEQVAPVASTSGGPIFILFDSLSFGPPVQGELENRLFDFLRQIADDGQQVTVVMTDSAGLHLVHDFTTDPKVLAHALRQLRGHSTNDDPTVSADAVSREITQLKPLTAQVAGIGGFRTF